MERESESPERARQAVPSAAAGAIRADVVSGDVSEDRGDLDSLSSNEQRSLWQALAEARREVRAIPENWAGRPENIGFDFYAQNARQNLTARFGSGGMRLASSDQTHTETDAEQPQTAWQATLKLESFAGEALTDHGAAEKPAQHGGQVDYHHTATLSEWYINGDDGIEHGYTIAQRPGHLGEDEQVTMGVSLQGLQVERGEDADTMVFKDGEREVLHYSKLKVFDARGTELPSSMQPTPSGILLAYHDVGALYPVTVDPLITSQEQRLAVDDAAAGDEFGLSVAIAGDSVVISAPRDDDAGMDSGSAYVFTRTGTTWMQQGKLVADDAAADDRLGSSVAIFGDTVVVGGDFNDDAGAESGSAYVFTRTGTTWTQQMKLTADDAAAGDRFGNFVSISGDSVLIAAVLDNGTGSAYVFTRTGTTWTQQQNLTAGDAAAGDQFGASVSIFGNSVIIGANADDGVGNNSGSAYVFTRTGTTWTQQQKLTASDAAADDTFGSSVSISGDSVVIGSFRDDDAGDRSGSAYVFTRSGTTWTQHPKLTGGATIRDEFGLGVAISGDNIVIGARLDDIGGINSGSASVFMRSGGVWMQQSSFTADDTAGDDRFGLSVAISGDSVVVGARLNNGVENSDHHLS